MVAERVRDRNQNLSATEMVVSLTYVFPLASKVSQNLDLCSKYGQKTLEENSLSLVCRGGKEDSMGHQ